MSYSLSISLIAKENGEEREILGAHYPGAYEQVEAMWLAAYKSIKMPRCRPGQIIECDDPKTVPTYSPFNV